MQTLCVYSFHRPEQYISENVWNARGIRLTRRSIWKCPYCFQKPTDAKPKTEKIEKAETKPGPVVPKGPIFVAAHVGSGYCRASITCSKGNVLAFAQTSCRMYENGIFREMSSEDVWSALLQCVKKVTDSVENGDYKGIGFTAVPALVCLDEKGNPITASVSRDHNINVIPYYDNRSFFEAQKINKARHAFQHYLGEQVLPELQESKLMWLKNNLNEDCWVKAGHFIELTDFLTWKATGSFIRSSSSLISQWTYKISITGEEGWNAQSLSEMGLPEVTGDNFKKIGSQVQRPGAPLPNGLLENQAKAMGLRPELPVATGMPDKLAGCLGLLGCHAKDVAQDVTNRLCIVFNKGSASHLILSRDPHFMKAVKGPLRDAVLPNMWLNHAETTTAESVLEYIIDTHPAMPNIRKQIGHMHIHKYLNKILKLHTQRKKLKSKSFLTNYLHVMPDYGGNKSPIGDPWIRGMVSGITLKYTQKSLAVLYLAAMQSLAYSTRHIISTLAHNGHDIRCILIGGDIGKNPVFVQLYKDVCQLPVVVPNDPRSKLIGAAILAGIASNHFRDFNHAIQEMCGTGEVSLPEKDPDVVRYHEKKYEVFLKMYDHQSEYRRIMGSSTTTERETDAKSG